MEEHYSPIRTPKQLIIVVVLAFAVLISVPALLSQLVTSGERGTHENPDVVLARIQPVGTVVIGEAPPPKGSLTGEQVYAQVCTACHEGGLAGAPKLGDKAAWAKVIAAGDKVAFGHAISGLNAMPPKGGNSELTDDEVKRAVAFMVNKAGGSWTAPAVTAVAAAPAVTPVVAAPSPAAAAPAPATAVAAAAPAAAAAGTGKQIYDSTCVACHGAGIAGAPKFGDKAAWAPRLKAGMPAVYDIALHGKGVMPPKGGNASLSDADVKAAVDYMVAAVR